MLIIADLVLAKGNGLISIFFGIALWGLHLGFTQGVLSTIVADHSPSELRGTAFGIFNFASAVALIIASVIAGYLWDGFGPKATFFASALMAILGAIFLVILLWFCGVKPITSKGNSHFT